jgi:hypothetical protein
MAGSILGKDQIAKLNAYYPAVYKHIKGLVDGAKDAADLMHVHFLVDHIDTPELSAIFRELPFISPDERRALVRMAIYDTITKREVGDVAIPNTDHAGAPVKAEPEALKEFKPAQFNLNVAATSDHKLV